MAIFNPVCRAVISVRMPKQILKTRFLAIAKSQSGLKSELTDVQ